MRATAASVWEAPRRFFTVSREVPFAEPRAAPLLACGLVEEWAVFEFFMRAPLPTSCSSFLSRPSSTRCYRTKQYQRGRYSVSTGSLLALRGVLKALC